MTRLALRAFAALLLFTSFAALAQALPSGVTRVTSVEGITEYQLANGLRVLLAPDASKPTTTVNTTYLVGSRHENYGETGMAHLLEHLLFKGTPTYPMAWLEFTRRGLRANGSTWVDRTNYFASFAANEENLDWYLRWSADAMTNSFIAKKDLDSEMTVVRNEMEFGENNPGRVLFQKTMATAYDWHNYSKSTIGARADVENVDIARLQAFYRNYYQPDNAVLILAGRFDEAKALRLIAETFGRIPRPARKLPPLYTIDPVQEGERSVTIRRVGDTQRLLAAYHVPPGSSADFAAVELVAEVMGDTPTGRLHKSLVETKQAANIFAFALALKEPGLVMFGAQLPNDAALDTARATLLATLEKVGEQPITGAEVERARTRLLKEFDLTLNDPEKIGVALSESIALGDWRLFFLRRDRIRAVKAEDVQRVAASYLLPDNRTLGTFVPTGQPKRAPAPAFADVAAMVKDYKGQAAIAQGEAFDATSENIEARTKRLKLDNGMRVALLQKKTRGATAHASLILRLGDEQSLFGTDPIGSLTAAMLNRGAGNLTRQQIQDEFDRLKAQVTFRGESTGVVVSIETIRENLPAVLKLVTTVVRQPTFPEQEFEVLRNERTTALEAQRKEPDAVGRLALARHGNPHPKGHVRYVPDFEEAIANTRGATLAQVKAFHASFYGADSATFAAVGDFDEAAVMTALREGLGNWKSAKPYKRVPNPSYAMPPAQVKLETPDKANAYFGSQLRFAMRDEDPDYAAMLLANYIVGGGTGSMLWKRIREKEGVSYGVGSGFAASPYEPSALWTASAIYAPQNAERLEQAFREEVMRVHTQGFTEQELKDARSGVLQRRQLDRAQDGSLAGLLASMLEIDRNMAFHGALDRKLGALTLAEATAVFRKYVDPAKLVYIYAGDFAKAKK
jgi:zinc protease